LNPSLEDIAQCNRRLLAIKQNKSKLHATLMEDCAQNRYCIHLNVHTNQINRIDWDETNIANIKTRTQEQHIKGQGLEIFGCLNYPSTPWWDFSIVQELIATTKGKMSNVKNFWTNILTTRSKWVVKLFLILFFIHPGLQTHLSSLTLPIIMAMDNSMNFNRLNNQWESNWLLANLIQIFVRGL